jgi:hypothetical protein
VNIRLPGRKSERPPIDGYAGHRHGNLAAAQVDIVQAFQRISDAQHANDGQLGGHAQRAKELLSEANGELRLAADVANEHQDEYQQPPQ